MGRWNKELTSSVTVYEPSTLTWITIFKGEDLWLTTSPYPNIVTNEKDKYAHDPPLANLGHQHHKFF